jgi:amino acid adenylation domain-containing protein
MTIAPSSRQISSPSSVPGAFAAQCARAPDAIAASVSRASMSYRTLQAASRAIATGLASRGIGPGCRVALHLPRGTEAIAAMLGVLEAGAAYVPLDPAEPPDRMAVILADCRPACVLTAGAATPHLAGVAVITLAELSRASPAPLLAPPQPDDPAYIMYTSGSTGQPKGVVVPHRAILRLVLAADYVDLGPDQTLLHMAPLAFDASTFEIWGALLTGGRLEIVPTDRPSIDDIASALTTRGVTTAWLTAGLFHLLADCRMQAFAGLRQLLAGGDVLSPTHAAAVLRAHPNLRLINGYGPTENTTFTCCHTITLDDCAAGSLPIGRPIHGSTACILDAGLHPVPPGEQGQLCTGGEGVALGYLNQPDLTAARFIPDPASPRPDARRYLTGDRAMQRPDGVILFLGRDDRQVKINGHRIELDAVEHALRAIPQVADAAVVAWPDPRGGKRLVAYVTGTAKDPLSTLRTTLPGWSLPSVIIPLPALPLTPNGKIDRARLPNPHPETTTTPTLTGIEAQLASIVAEILSAPSVGRDENFFDLGATSLHLIEIHARITRTLWPDLPLLTLFDAPRISQLAARFAPAPLPAPRQDPTTRAQRAAAAMQRARLARPAPSPHP